MSVLKTQDQGIIVFGEEAETNLANDTRDPDMNEVVARIETNIPVSSIQAGAGAVWAVVAESVYSAMFFIGNISRLALKAALCGGFIISAILIRL